MTGRPALGRAGEDTAFVPSPLGLGAGWAVTPDARRGIRLSISLKSLKIRAQQNSRGAEALAGVWLAETAGCGGGAHGCQILSSLSSLSDTGLAEFQRRGGAGWIVVG